MTHRKSDPAVSSDIRQRVERVIREQVRNMNAYHVPPARGMIKLDAMENPFRWPSALTEDWLNVLRGVAVNRYPDPTAAALMEELRRQLELPPSLSVLFGNGSDEIIQMMVLASAGQSVLAPTPTFVMYKVISDIAGSPFTGVPLRADFSLDVDAVVDAIQKQKPSLVFIAYPNNPSGNLFDRGALEQVIAASPGLVVMDEAYHPFAGDSWLGQVMDYPNLVVMRTMSKLGLAGLRLGYLVGDPHWLDEFNKVRLPYNINVLTQASVQFALQHSAVFDKQASDIRIERARMFDSMTKLSGIEVFPSATNFLLFRTERPAQQVFDFLYQNNILIKNLSQPDGPLHNCLRVTVGAVEENDLFLQVLSTSLGN